jgi:hypothetical protein
VISVERYRTSPVCPSVNSSCEDNDCQNDNDWGKPKYLEQNSSHCQFNEPNLYETLRSYLAENTMFLIQTIQLTDGLIIKYSVRKPQEKQI